MKILKYSLSILSAAAASCVLQSRAQVANVTLHTQQLGAKIAPTMHGAFFEEISHGGEGGLYAELIQNRGFEDAQIPKGDTLKDGKLIPPRTPHYSMPNQGVSDWWMPWTVTSDYPAWSSVQNAKLQIASVQPLNVATPHYLTVTTTQGNAGIQNTGFWGIDIQNSNTYLLSFYLRNGHHYNGNVTASLIGANGKVLMSKIFRVNTSSQWSKYTASMKASATDTKAHFELTFDQKGTIDVDFVSLFPKNTFRNRPNGLRLDLAQKIADLHPAFLRWPGGCFVEGINIQSAPNWKETIGPVEQRPATFSPWDYYTSNGFGYDEYLQYCEDIGAKAMYVFNVGISCEMRSGTYVTGDTVQNYIQDALDAVEYAIGSTSTKWGALRAKNGHPKPYPLEYLEIGNEQHGELYAKRYNLFYDAIHAKYPQLKLIAAMGIGDVDGQTLKYMDHVQYADEHSYKGAFWAMGNYDHFDRYPRDKEWKVYVGEYATNNGVGRGNMIASLSDAVYIMGMERNGDLIKMSSYAPLLANVNDEDWPVNLINFDNHSSYGRISYYLLKMMQENRPSVNIKTEFEAKQNPAVLADVFKGGIGLATWDTHSEYKDIQVIANGKKVYRSDFVHRPSEWQSVRGEWKIQDSAYAEVADGAQTFAYLKDHSFANYTLKMKARKLDGYNGFILPFAVKDSNTFNRLHIGAWVNAVTLVEGVSNGYDVANLSSPARLPFAIEKGKWYDLTLQVMGDSLAAYIDDKLLISFKNPSKFFALGGKIENEKVTTVQLVNAYATPYTTKIHLDGSQHWNSKGELIMLSAPDGEAENSLQFPTKYIPVKKMISNVSKDFEITLPPFSFSILRLKNDEK